MFSLSVQIAHLFPASVFDMAAFLAQTGLYLLTLYPFLKFVRNRFLYILLNIPKRAFSLLLAESLVWFLTMIVLNYTFVMSHLLFLRVNLPAGPGGERRAELHHVSDHSERSQRSIRQNSRISCI